MTDSPDFKKDKPDIPGIPDIPHRKLPITEKIKWYNAASVFVRNGLKNDMNKIKKLWKQKRIGVVIPAVLLPINVVFNFIYGIFYNMGKNFGHYIYYITKLINSISGLVSHSKVVNNINLLFFWYLYLCCINITRNKYCNFKKS